MERDVILKGFIYCPLSNKELELKDACLKEESPCCIFCISYEWNEGSPKVNCSYEETPNSPIDEAVKKYGRRE